MRLRRVENLFHYDARGDQYIITTYVSAFTFMWNGLTFGYILIRGTHVGLYTVMLDLTVSKVGLLDLSIFSKMKLRRMV